MTEDRKSEKLRLNITVDKEVVEKAKDMGFNISAAFEEYLRIFTYKPEGNTSEDIIKAYDSLLTKIQPILKQYDTKIEIGKVTRKNHVQTTKGSIDYYGCKIFFDAETASILKDGKYYVDTDVVREFDLFVSPKETQFLYEPKEILKNLVIAIRKAAGGNTAKVQKLNLAMKLVNALFNNDENSSESGLETPLFRRILESSGIESIHDTKSVSTAEAEGEEIITA